MMPADLDVIVTYCNLARYVSAAVDSALDQDGFQPAVIVVDDASDEPLQHQGWPNDRVSVIRRDRRGGYGAAINSGLAHSDAGLVAFLDADDLWPSFHCQVLADALHQRSAEIAYGAQVLFNDGDLPQLRFTDAERVGLPAATPGPLGGTVLIRRDLLERAGPLPEDLPMAAFQIWLARARRMHPAPVEAPVGQVVLLRRTHGSNLSRKDGAQISGYLEAIAAHRRRS